MNDLEQTKQDYLKAKDILYHVSNADDRDISTCILRRVWDVESLEKLRELVNLWEDQGIHLTIQKN